jgi:hypothetical protein
LKEKKKARALLDQTGALLGYSKVKGWRESRDSEVDLEATI